MIYAAGRRPFLSPLPDKCQSLKAACGKLGAAAEKVRSTRKTQARTNTVRRASSHIRHGYDLRLAALAFVRVSGSSYCVAQSSPLFFSRSTWLDKYVQDITSKFLNKEKAHAA